MIIFCISQNAIALLKKFRVIFRSLGFVFLFPKVLSRSTNRRPAGKLGFKVCFGWPVLPREPGRVCPSPWSPSTAVAPAAGVLAMQAPASQGRGTGPLLTPGFEEGGGMMPWSTVPQGPVCQPHQLGCALGR